MAISIKSPEADRKLRRVARLLGKSLTAMVIELADGKLKELDRERKLRAVDRIVRRVKTRPVLDRTADEIIGYNEDGLFD